MNFIRLNLIGGGKLLIDKTLIIYAVDWGKHTTITLNDKKEYDVAETADELEKFLKS